MENKENTNDPDNTKRNSMYEIVGYIAIFLTILGQVMVNITPIAGQSIWFVSNILYIIKAVKQDMGRAEILRNIVMTAITTVLMVLCAFGVFDK